MKAISIKCAAYSALISIYLGIWVIYFRAIDYHTNLTINTGFLATLLSTLTVLLFYKLPHPMRRYWLKLNRFINIDSLGLAILLSSIGIAFLFAVPAINDRSVSVYLTSTVAKYQNGIEVNKFEDFINDDWNRNNLQLTRRIAEQAQIGNFKITEDNKILCPTKQLIIFSKINLFVSKALGINLKYVLGSDLSNTEVSVKASQC